ncbi:hypothetical protein P152DRAFT_446952 [Eremomyces bilateralis CBS 781.70]|uniref:Uncharacterized protein n=1 Tax=Eremomyces bilateralis CBS 781.70 TaxID=1392243 RepID=A0A6G1GDL4_9PEZI|nr:uncharacterized protein P152DRAFT_446952 [Eremomyces bilateralis CBS 781.70]KAF1815959.1 hypothetical protein P152DRAFT_446952 [Eremomyces bilateralis CBS 781.70]
MKVQLLIPILPFLVGLVAAFPAVEPSSVPAVSSTIPNDVPISIPIPLPEGQDTGGDEGAFEDEGQSAIDEGSLPREGPLEKRKLPASIHWEKHPNINFKVGRNINVRADVTLHKDGKVRFYTEVNNRRRWAHTNKTVTNTNVKNNWQSINENPESLSCFATAAWNFGKVVDWVLDWIKDHKEETIAVIAIISAVVAAS